MPRGYPISRPDTPSRRLRLERIARSLTQQELADLAAIRQADLSLFELGRMNPTPEELRRLATALGVSADVLLAPVRLSEVTP